MHADVSLARRALRLAHGKVEQDTPWATATQTFPVRVEGNEVYVELE